MTCIRYKAISPVSALSPHHYLFWHLVLQQAELVESGEFAYADDSEVLTRRWAWRNRVEHLRVTENPPQLYFQ